MNGLNGSRTSGPQGSLNNCTRQFSPGLLSSQSDGAEVGHCGKAAAGLGDWRLLKGRPRPYESILAALYGLPDLNTEMLSIPSVPDRGHKVDHACCAPGRHWAVGKGVAMVGHKEADSAPPGANRSIWDDHGFAIGQSGKLATTSSQWTVNSFVFTSRV